MKNQLKDLSGGSRREKNTASLGEYAQAFLVYLRRPKTVFDLCDRARLLALLIIVIILLQKVVQLLSD